VSGAHHHHHADRSSLTLRAAAASIATALVLIGLKAWAALETSSMAMLGSLADSSLDLVASLIVLLAVRVAAAPADRDHRFGHGKAEALAALVQVILITLSALFILARSGERLLSGAPTTDAELGIGVSVLAILFTFYTNVDSRKGAEIAANSRAALLFYWKSLRRQVRVEGGVEPVSDADADAYFATRSRESQLGAWASFQSRPLDSRATFEARFEEVARRFRDGPVPRPPRWGGFVVTPELLEFWSDRPHRLHERRLFTRSGERWAEGLLYP